MAIVARQRKSGVVYYVNYFADGKERWEKCGTDRREAERLERRRRTEIANGTYVPRGGTGAVTVKSFADEWMKKLNNRNVDSDRRNLEQHVLSVLWFASLRMEDVRPRHVIQLVEELKVKVSKATSKPLATKTVSNIFGVLHTMFRDALLAEVITSTPCILPRGTINRRKKRKRLPYRAEEVAKFLSISMPEDLRVLAALLFFTGLREGELAGLTWGSWVRDSRPLGALHVDVQYDGQVLKTEEESGEQSRRVPVHPMLAEILSAWHREGFELQHCQKPRATSPILPRKGALHHTKSSLYKMWRRACIAAGVDNHSLHSTRHTFITLARRGGAPKDVVEQITHNAKGDIVDEYTTWDWSPLCAAVCCVTLQNLDANLDVFLKPLENKPKIVEAPGIEPGSENYSPHASTYVADVLDRLAILPSAGFPRG